MALLQPYQLSEKEKEIVRQKAYELQQVWLANPDLKDIAYTVGIKSSQVIATIALDVIKERNKPFI